MERTGTLSGVVASSPATHDRETSAVTVLVGFAEALAAPEVVWSLVDEGFQVVAFARRGRESALHYSHHVVIHEICPPETDLDAAQSDLQTLMNALTAKSGDNQLILFPLDDTAVWLCSAAPREHQWLLAGPQGASTELALNKQLQVEAALDAGFNVPRTVFARTGKEVLEFCGAASFPVILKSAECVPIGQNRVKKCAKWICATQSEVERAISQWGERVPLLVQPFIEGIGEGVFGLAAPEGIRAWSAHKRVRMMNPQGSGSSACVSQPVPADLRACVQELIRQSEWQGLFMVEVLRDGSGKAWFVELNGRPWGSMALSRRQGLEYPAWHLKLAMDPESDAGTTLATATEVVCRHMGREFMHVLFVLRGPKSKALKNWPSFWKTIGEVLRVRRSDVFYNWRREDPKVFFADCYYTVHSNLFKSRN